MMYLRKGTDFFFFLNKGEWAAPSLVPACCWPALGTPASGGPWSLLRKLCGDMLLPSWVVYYFILYYTVGQDPHHPSRNDGSLLGCTFSQTLKKPKGTNLWDRPPDLSALSSPQGSQAASSHLKRYRFEEWFWTYWWVSIVACLSAITKHHRLYDLKSETYFVTILEAGSPRFKSCSLPGLKRATFLLCPQHGDWGKELWCLFFI